MITRARSRIAEIGPAMQGNRRRPPAGRAAGVALTVALLAIAPSTAAPPARTPVESRIVEVTLFLDRAEVVREARVELPPGASTVELTGLPIALESDSLRVSARGTSATLGAVELKERADRPSEPPELSVARDEVARIQRELAAVDADSEVSAELREFLNSLRASATKNESTKLAEGRPDIVSVEAYYSLLRGRLQELGRDRLARTEKREKLQRELAVARAKLEAARPGGEIRSRAVTIDIAAERAGAITLRIAYLVPGASWSPAYRASLAPDTGEIALVSEAVVRNATGEDWSDVALRLSTAAPARGVAPPELASRHVRTAELPPLGRSYQTAARLSPGGTDRGRSESSNGDGVAGGIVGGVVGGVLGGVLGGEEGSVPGGSGPADGGSTSDPLRGASLGNINPDEVVKPAGGFAGALANVGDDAGLSYQVRLLLPAEAQVVHSAYNVAFEVQGRSEVPADKGEHRVVLRTETLAGTLEYRCAPSLNPAAYLVAKTTAPGAYPLLAGPVRLFSASGYIGMFALSETAPRAELTVPFGADNRVRIERTALARERTSEGFAGRDRRIARAFRTTMENLQDRPVTIVMEESLPVSDDERVQIEKAKTMTPGWVEDPRRPGVLAWTFTVDPGQKRELLVEYGVRFPKSVLVAGLN